MALPSIFEPSIFSRRIAVPASPYIRAMHPKTEIRPEPAAMKRVLDMGWAGQAKIHGHRAQFHISADPAEEVLAYNRQGVFHKKEVPDEVQAELRRIFQPTAGWSVVDAEWLKTENKIYVFDYLKKDGVILRGNTYQERYDLLPRLFISPIVETLPLLRTLDKCLAVLERDEETLEGLVFKALDTPGFNDTSIIRCRKVSPFQP